MKTETKILISILIFSLALIAGAVFFFGKNSGNTLSDLTVNIDYSRGEKLGSDSAKLKLVEYSDLQCPACKTVEPYVAQIREKYKDNFNFQLIYKHFPLMQHVHSKKAANFAELAATKGKFWEIHDKLFETQDAWSVLPDPTDYFINLGVQFGLDKDKIKEAVLKESFSQIINEEFAEGQRIGVDSTPSFYLNNKKLILKSFEDLDRLVSEGL